MKDLVMTRHYKQADQVTEADNWERRENLVDMLCKILSHRPQVYGERARNCYMCGEHACLDLVDCQAPSFLPPSRLQLRTTPYRHL